MTLLQVENVSVDFGGVHALEGVDLDIAEGELLGLIGPNGAGKTTLLRVLVGALRPTGGRIRFKGADITGLPTHRRAQQGIAFTHQIVRPFRHMTLIENVVVAAEPVTSIDVTSADMLAELEHTLSAARIELRFAEMKDPVKDKLRRFELFDRFGEGRFHATLGSAVHAFLTEYAIK